LSQRNLDRRLFLGAAFALPLGGCVDMADLSGLFGGRPKYTLTPRGDRMVRWIQHEGHDVMMAPDALTVMGINNGGRDVPVSQLAFDATDGTSDRYVVSLVSFRKVYEFVFHRRQGEVLVFHHSDTSFKRLTSVRYPRNGKPTYITDTAFAENDFGLQLAFWFDRMPGR
jgi:hypothetical protein